MALVLKVLGEQKELLGDDYIREFGEDGGTIGRSLHSDWILPDPDRYVSGKHATIDYRSGAYYLADISSNGVYVNDSNEPLGKGNPRRLFDGDRIRMGSFEFLVSLDEGEDLAMPPDPAPTIVPDNIEQLVAEEPDKTSIQLLDEEEITGDEEFQSTLFGGAAKEAEASFDELSKQIDKMPDPVAAAEPPEKAKGPTPADMLDALLKGAGISRAEIHPSVDPLDVMRNAGMVLQEFIGGMTELLKCRSNLKSIFRLDQTSIMPRHNNPLKLSVSTKYSMKQLLVGEAGEYLGPVDSVREVCRDLKFHHDAVVAAMNASFSEFADRFDPDELKENFDKTLKKKPLFDSLSQLRYWRLYCDLYPIMTQRGSGQFPHMLGEEFVREYEKQITEFQRLDRSNAETQRISKIQVVPDPPAKGETLQDQPTEARAGLKL
jgi:predicted component of type VI protein secretion system